MAVVAKELRNISTQASLPNLCIEHTTKEGLKKNALIICDELLLSQKYLAKPRMGIGH
jgi:hypothetical protein